jgi:hypothetical protein
MSKGPQPHQIADYFFKTLMHNQCNTSWSLFSQKSKKTFLDWTLKDIYQRNPEAAQVAKLSHKEVQLLFEKNDSSVMKTFWKRFFYNSGANDFFRFGYYQTLTNDGKKAVVRVTFQYPDGRGAQVDLSMVNEKGGWKLAYVESGMPF